MDKSFFAKQLSEIINSFELMKLESQYNDLSDLPKDNRQSIVTKSIAAVTRITGEKSVYIQEINRIIKNNPELHIHTSSIVGVIKALLEDLESGFLDNISEIIHAEVFSDFLDMADYLNNNGHKDAAAVIAGTTLENHIKKISIKNDIPTETSGKPMRADRINSELTKAKVYNLSEQKNITAWLDIRNNAAHGNYEKYNQELSSSSLVDCL